MRGFSRRAFLGSAASVLRANSRIRIAVVGLNRRGRDRFAAFMSCPRRRTWRWPRWRPTCTSAGRPVEGWSVDCGKAEAMCKRMRPLSHRECDIAREGRDRPCAEAMIENRLIGIPSEGRPPTDKDELACKGGILMKINVLVVLAGLATAALFAQEYRGTFSGVGTDPQGAAIPGRRSSPRRRAQARRQP